MAGDNELPVTSRETPSSPRDETIRTALTRGERWRKAAYLGARFGPRWWLRHSPTLIGALAWMLLGSVRRRVVRNLRAVGGIPSGGSESLAVLETFVNFSHCLAESLAAGRVESQAARVDITGAELLDAAITDGSGLVVVTAHVGAWDIAARMLLRDTQRSVTAVMDPEAGTKAGAIQDTVRTGAGVRVHHVGRGPLESLPLLRTLRNGGIVAIQLDRCPPGSRSATIPLFGQSVEVPLGPFVLAALAGVPVLPAFVARRGFFSYAAEVAAPIRLPRRPTESQLREAVGQATSAMEVFIRRHPTQWFHFSDG